MIFFKILQQFLVPSFFIFILILAGLLISLKRNKRKIGKILLLAGLLFYYLFSTTIVSNFLLSPLENKYYPLGIEEISKTDKVVLLLGGREADVLRGSEVLRIFNFQFSIFNEFSNHNFQIIISGVNPLRPERNEAKEVKEFLVERGIRGENIILEDKSRNTFENAKNIKELLDDELFFLVTSGYHMSRSVEVFQKMGANPIPAPTDFKIKTEEYNVLDFLPDAQNLRKSDLAFHEYFGILWYRLRY